MAGLLGHGRKRGPFLLRLHDTDGEALNEQEVIAAAGFERNLT